MSEPIPEAQVDVLLQKYLSGAMTEDEGRMLLRLLRDHPEIEDGFNAEIADAVWTHCLIGHYYQSEKTTFSLELSSEEPEGNRVAPAGRAETTSGISMDELARRAAETALAAETAGQRIDRKQSHREKAFRNAQPGTWIPLRYLLTPFLLAFGLLIYFEWRPPKDETGSELAARMKSTPAILVDRDDVRWPTDTRPPGRGESLPPGPLNFESGTIELLFYNGVRGVVEGPAELLLIDEKHVFCKRGRWSVTVPEQGKGFEIQTPNLTVRDQGTRFYAAVEKDRCDVHVVEGTVETERHDGVTTMFKTGFGAAYRGGELLRRLSGAADGFLTRADMRRRSDATLFPDGMPDAESLAALQETAVCRIDVSRDLVEGATPVGGEIVDGPEPESKAFRFGSETDHIRLRPLEGVASTTAVLRLRIDRLNSGMNPILMSEGYPVGGIVWHVSADGTLIVGIRQRSRVAGMFETPVLISNDLIGTWVRLALTIDAPKRALTVYMDGSPVFAATLPFVPKLDLDKVDLGNWEPSGRNEGRIWHLDGAVSEALVFDRPLRLEEIRLLQQY